MLAGIDRSETGFDHLAAEARFNDTGGQYDYAEVEGGRVRSDTSTTACATTASGCSRSSSPRDTTSVSSAPSSTSPRNQAVVPFTLDHGSFRSIRRMARPARSQHARSHGDARRCAHPPLRPDQQPRPQVRCLELAPQRLRVGRWPRTPPGESCLFPPIQRDHRRHRCRAEVRREGEAARGDRGRDLHRARRLPRRQLHRSFADRWFPMPQSVGGKPLHVRVASARRSGSAPSPRATRVPRAGRRPLRSFRPERGSGLAGLRVRREVQDEGGRRPRTRKVTARLRDGARPGPPAAGRAVGRLPPALREDARGLPLAGARPRRGPDLRTLRHQSPRRRRS